MNLKIECACGQKIAFEVEPENGAMPCDLPCPSCQSDVTGLANADIQRQLSVVTAAPAVAPTGARLRVSAPSHAPAAAPAAPEAPAVSAAPPPAETPRAPKPMAAAYAAAAAAAPVTGDDGEASGKAFLMGTVGVLLGAFAGIVVWYLIAKMGLNLRILAILVAVGAGAGGRFFCRGGDKGLGGVAAVIAVIGMFFGGAITFNKSVVNKFSMNDKELRASYEEEVKTAKAITTQIPGGTDEEIRRYLEKGQAGGTSITVEDMADFRNSDEFKGAKDLASGKTTFESYAQNYHKVMDDVSKETVKFAGAFGAARMLSVWLIILIGSTAYKIAAG